MSRLRFSILVALPAIVFSASACGGSDDDPTDDGPVDISALTYNECAPEARIGGFTIELAADFTAAGGRVRDAVSPIGVLETVLEMGECRQARAQATFCDPGCAGGDLCGLDGQCHPAPASRSVGAVTIRGLSVPVEMNPVAPGFNYTNSGTLPHPPFAEGDGIAIDSEGGDYEPFTLLGAGIAALETSATTLMVTSGSALDLSWTPSPASGPTRVSIDLNINLHGTAGSRIECLVADSGSFSIPEALVTALVDDGLSGFPSVTISRSSADSTTIEPGCVDFKVISEKTIEVEIPGLESCSVDEDCDVAGETCQPDLTCG